MTAVECMKTVRNRLMAAGVESADYESRVFLEWLAGIDRAEYFMNPNRELLPEQWEKIDEMVSRREKREPLQYLMGTCDFMGYEFHVDERVLIPRQDTECLVELALEKITQYEKNLSRPLKILDLCSGSGCIGISVKLFKPQHQVSLVDISEGALEVAKGNAQSLEADVTLIHSDLFADVDTKYDFILSNPPYIPTEVCRGLMPEVIDHEPILALDGEEDGLAFYRRIIKEAPQYLVPGGSLMFEIGAEQGQAVSELMQSQGFVDVVVRKDLAGLDRIVSGAEP